MQNRLSAAVGAPTRGYHYEPHRYAGMDDHAIAAQLHRFAGVLLLRGRLQTLLVRREIGGFLCEFAKHHPKDRVDVRGDSSPPRSVLVMRRSAQAYSVMGRMASLRIDH